MKETIIRYLQEAKTLEGLELLVKIAPEARVLLTQFNEAAKRNRLGIIPYQEFSQKQNEVTYSALEILGRIQDDGGITQIDDIGDSSADRKKGGAKVFISYSRHDRDQYLLPMTKHLSPLVRGGLLETWDDSKIPPGEDWDATIKEKIRDADIILLLVSANSLNTDYIWNIEIKAAMERRSAGVRVVPIILSPCQWEVKDKSGNFIFPPAALNALPFKGKPVSSYENPDVAWNDVATGILKILEG
ncbi:MAG: TIR domain-containing protein [Saprospiraceae bacterium]